MSSGRARRWAARRPRRGHAGAPPPRVASTASTPPPVPAR
ncbi:hypothetical protein HMPREF1550_01694 [Actinomyces sp. oral taxon 877 str. F0543]|nr:hypothetical protein HMPREF1550_01694 [Actinomyces sp. oral taxon 877 str. F0543]